MPKSRLDFWEPKLTKNRERDLQVNKLLAEQGWKVLVVWECELRDKAALEQRIKEFLKETGKAE
jgi:DNA mismatch endonuclease (patch repair protein)